MEHYDILIKYEQSQQDVDFRLSQEYKHMRIGAKCHGMTAIESFDLRNFQEHYHYEKF